MLFVVFFVIPAIVVTAGCVTDVFQLAGRGSVPNDRGHFIYVVSHVGTRRFNYLPTALSWLLIATFLVALISFISSYAWLKRRVYHDVWKRKFRVCPHCNADLPTKSRPLACPGCEVQLPKVGVEQAWKEWYDSTWDEFTWDIDHGRFYSDRSGHWWF